MLLLFSLLLATCCIYTTYSAENSLLLDRNIDMKVQWSFPDKDYVVFVVEANTSGYVGFGFSETGGMTNADYFMAGVDTNGSKYIKNRYGLEPYPNGHYCPSPAPSEHWSLIDAKEDNGVTQVTVSRPLDPDNDNSYKLSHRPENVTMIFAYLTNDFTDDCDSYHGTNRGSKKTVKLF